MENRTSWEDYFMHLAEESALRSKDPHTKVGACIVKDKRILSLGYNGAPRNFPDEKVPKDNSDILYESKNAYMCHAELNAILNYRGSLSELEGATVYVTHSPCHDCMKALVQLGIKEVVYKTLFHTSDSTKVSMYIAKQCGVICRQYKE